MNPILIIEDENDLAELLHIHLTELGYETDIERDGLAGLNKALKNPYDLIVLDIMLPRMDGLEICRRIRSENPYTPVLMLTAKTEEVDKVLGLELGADGYMTKPFSIREFIARVKSILRRVRVDQEQSTPSYDSVEINLGDIVINTEKRRVTFSGEQIELTAKEFDLLLLFAGNPGRAYSRQELLDLVWGYSYNGYSHTVNSHINRIRSKIENDPANPRYIKTVWGHGYKFAEADELV